MDYYQNGFRHAGAFLMYTVPIALMMLSSTKDYWTDPVLAAGAEAARKNHLEWLAAMPLKKGLSPLSLADPDNEQWFFDMMTHADYDEFWKRQTLIPSIRGVKVPTLNVAGWWDQEDFYGPQKIYEKLEAHDRDHRKKMTRLDWGRGPEWTHGGRSYA